MRRFVMPAATLGLIFGGLVQAGGAGGPTGGTGQVLAATPAAVLAALRAAGLKVTMNPARPDADPSMTVLAGSYEIQVWLSDCKAGTCGRLTASTAWDYSDADGPDMQIVNDWNSNYYTQAYSYEGNYYLDSTMPLRGGYTAAALKAWWADYLNDVKDYEQELP